MILFLFCRILCFAAYTYMSHKIQRTIFSVCTQNTHLHTCVRINRQIDRYTHNSNIFYWSNKIIIAFEPKQYVWRHTQLKCFMKLQQQQQLPSKQDAQRVRDIWNRGVSDREEQGTQQEKNVLMLLLEIHENGKDRWHIKTIIILQHKQL